MKLFLDTNAIIYTVNKKTVNASFISDIRNTPLTISIYSIYEIINQLGVDGYLEHIRKFTAIVGGFQVATNSLFKISDKEIIDAFSQPNNDFKTKLYEPIVAELKRNITNRLNLAWFIFLTTRAPLCGYRPTKDELLYLLNDYRNKITTYVDKELHNLERSNNLNEKYIKILYKKIKDAIFIYILQSFVFYENDFFNALKNLNIENCSFIALDDNYLKLNLNTVKSYNLDLFDKLSLEQVADILVENTFKRFVEIDTQLSPLEETIMKQDIRDIIINQDVFVANNYIDIDIMRLYLEDFTKYNVATSRTDYFLITFDDKFRKRLSKFNISTFNASVTKSKTYCREK